MRRGASLLLALLLSLAGPGDALAKKGAGKKTRKPVTVPVQIGIGPAIHNITGPLADDQIFHYGLKTYAAAVLDREWLNEHKKAIPKAYRKRVLKMNEVRISPLILALIPDTVWISPKIGRTGMYGAAFRPLAFGFAPVSTGTFRLDLAAGLLLAYAYIHSDVPRIGTTHFLRPGIDLKLSMEVAFSRAFQLSFGWASQFYVPQTLGASLWDVSFKGSLWHVGQAFLLANFRFPYEYTL